MTPLAPATRIRMPSGLPQHLDQRLVALEQVDRDELERILVGGVVEPQDARAGRLVEGGAGLEPLPGRPSSCKIAAPAAM